MKMELYVFKGIITWTDYVALRKVCVCVCVYVLTELWVLQQTVSVVIAIPQWKKIITEITENNWIYKTSTLFLIQSRLHLSINIFNYQFLSHC